MAHFSSKAPRGVSWSCCQVCIKAQISLCPFLFLSSLPRCWSSKHSLIYVLESNSISEFASGTTDLWHAFNMLCWSIFIITPQGWFFSSLINWDPGEIPHQKSHMLGIHMLFCLTTLFILFSVYHEKMKMKVAQLCLALFDSSPWNSPGQNTGMGCHALLQGIFPTQGSNPGFPHCRWFFISWATNHVAS